MRAETLALHAGFDADPATGAVAVPIYQTAAYQFDSAPITARRCSIWSGRLSLQPHRQSHRGGAGRARRGAGRRGRRAGHRHRPGGAVLCLRQCGAARRQHRFGAAALRHHPHAAAPCAAGPGRRRRASPPATAPKRMAACIDENTRAVFCETVGNPAGNICDIEAIAEGGARPRRSADRGQYRGDADPAAARRTWRRYRRAFAHQIHGRPWQRRWAACWWMAAISTGWRTPRASRNSPRRMHPITAWSMPSVSASAAFIARARSVYQRTTGAILSPMSAFLLLQGIETVALRVERHVENARSVAEFLRGDARRGLGGICRLPRKPLLRAGAEISGRPRPLAADLRRARAASKPASGSTMR